LKKQPFFKSNGIFFRTGKDILNDNDYRYVWQHFSLQTGGDTGYIRDCENTFAQLSSWKRDGKYSTVSDDLEK